MKHEAPIPAHEQIAEFRVGAILATQAIAVYIDSEASSAMIAPRCTGAEIRFSGNTVGYRQSSALS